MLRMRVDATTRVSQGERIPEQRRARRLLQVKRWSTQEDAIRRWILRVRYYENVRRLDAFLLHSRRRDVDNVAVIGSAA